MVLKDQLKNMNQYLSHAIDLLKEMLVMDREKELEILEAYREVVLKLYVVTVKNQRRIIYILNKKQGKKSSVKYLKIEYEIILLIQDIISIFGSENEKKEMSKLSETISNMINSYLLSSHCVIDREKILADIEAIEKRVEILKNTINSNKEIDRSEIAKEINDISEKISQIYDLLNHGLKAGLAKDKDIKNAAKVTFQILQILLQLQTKVMQPNLKFDKMRDIAHNQKSYSNSKHHINKEKEEIVRSI